MVYLLIYFLIGLLVVFYSEVHLDIFSNSYLEKKKYRFDWLTRIMVFLIWPIFLVMVIKNLIDSFK